MAQSRKPMSRKSSSSKFSQGKKVHPKNMKMAPMRGGIRA